MSDIDRAELRRLLEEAHSKLPWGMGTEEGYDYGIIYGAPYEREGGGYLLIPTVADPSYGEDAALITAAVNALPGLLDALDVAEATTERVREMHYPADDDPARTPRCEKCRGRAGVHPCGC